MASVGQDLPKTSPLVTSTSSGVTLGDSVRLAVVAKRPCHLGGSCASGRAWGMSPGAGFCSSSMRITPKAASLWGTGSQYLVEGKDLSRQ